MKLSVESVVGENLPNCTISLRFFFFASLGDHAIE